MNENKNTKQTYKKFHDSNKKKNHKPVNNKFTKDGNKDRKPFKKNADDNSFFGFNKKRENSGQNRENSSERPSFQERKGNFRREDKNNFRKNFRDQGDNDNFPRRSFKSDSGSSPERKFKKNFQFKDKSFSADGDVLTNRHYSRGANRNKPSYGNRLKPDRQVRDDIGNRKPRFEQEERDDIGNRKFEDRKFSNRRFEDKKFGDNKFRDRKSEDKKFGDNKFRDRKSEDKKFGDNKFRDRKSEDKKFGDNKFRDRKSEDRKFGDNKFKDRKFEDRKFGDNKFRDRKFEDRKFGDDNFKERNFEDRKFGDNKFRDRKSEDRKFTDNTFKDRKFEDRKFEERKSQRDDFEYRDEDVEEVELPPEKREVRRSKMDPSEWKPKTFPKTSKKFKINKDKAEKILEESEEEKIDLLDQLKEESFTGDARNFSDGEAERVFRINRFLAKSGLGARREVEELIKNGKIKVNGEVETSLSRKIDVDKDVVEYEDEKIELISDKTILAFNKPEGYLCSHHDVHHDKTVFNLLPLKYRKFNMAGRLDLTSRGLMIFSADGEVLNQISHPSFAIKKRYIVKVDKPIQESDFVATFLKGIDDEGEMLRAKEVSVIDSENSVISISLQEGKKRQIHRMFKAIGYKVVDLQRVQIGKLMLDDLDLPEGKYKEVKVEDIFG